MKPDTTYTHAETAVEADPRERLMQLLLEANLPEKQLIEASYLLDEYADERWLAGQQSMLLY